MSAKHDKITGECHAACLLLPEMPENEFRELVEDIRDKSFKGPAPPLRSFHAWPPYAREDAL